MATPGTFRGRICYFIADLARAEISGPTIRAGSDWDDGATEFAMLIELDGVTKTYGKVTALRGLSVTLPEGSIGLLGPNGAGKTTMIRSLLGLIALDAGSGRVLGMDIRTSRMDIRQSVGFVPEDECLFPAGMRCNEPMRYSTMSAWEKRVIGESSRTRRG